MWYDAEKLLELSTVLGLCPDLVRQLDLVLTLFRTASCTGKPEFGLDYF